MPVSVCPNFLETLYMLASKASKQQGKAGLFSNILCAPDFYGWSTTQFFNKFLLCLIFSEHFLSRNVSQTGILGAFEWRWNHWPHSSGGAQSLLMPNRNKEPTFVSSKGRNSERKRNWRSSLRSSVTGGGGANQLQSLANSDEASVRARNTHFSLLLSGSVIVLPILNKVL